MDSLKTTLTENYSIAFYVLMIILLIIVINYCITLFSNKMTLSNTSYTIIILIIWYLFYRNFVLM